MTAVVILGGAGLDAWAEGPKRGGSKPIPVKSASHLKLNKKESSGSRYAEEFANADPSGIASIAVRREKADSYQLKQSEWSMLYGKLSVRLEKLKLKHKNHKSPAIDLRLKSLESYDHNWVEAEAKRIADKSGKYEEKSAPLDDAESTAVEDSEDDGKPTKLSVGTRYKLYELYAKESAEIERILTIDDDATKSVQVAPTGSKMSTTAKFKKVEPGTAVLPYGSKPDPYGSENSAPTDSAGEFKGSEAGVAK